MGEKHENFDDPEPVNHLNIETEDIENSNGIFNDNEREPDYPSELNTQEDQYAYAQEGYNQRPAKKSKKKSKK